MCGIFGFVGSKTDISIIELIGVEAAKRGPQAWGVAWPQENEMHVYKQEKKFDAKEMQKLKRYLQIMLYQLWLVIAGYQPVEHLK